MAQRLAQGTHNPWVGSSNLSGPTKYSQVRQLSGLFFVAWFVRVVQHDAKVTEIAHVIRESA